MATKKSAGSTDPSKSAEPKKAAAKKAPAKKTAAKAAVTKSKPTHAEIAKLAEKYWHEGGSKHHTAEQDWLRAEKELTEAAK